MTDTLLTIGDTGMLAAITETIRLRGIVEDTDWTIGAGRWDLASVLAGKPEAVGGPQAVTAWPNLPEAALLARMQLLIDSGLIDSGLVDGCACGCRGDFVLTAST